MVDFKERVALNGVDFIHDTELSIKAKGLLSIMKNFGKPLTLEEFLKLSKDGYSSTQRGLQELVLKGYYYSSPIRNSKGVFKSFKQKVRFTVGRPEFYSEKAIIGLALSHQRLNESDLVKIKNAYDIIFTDSCNCKKLQEEISALAELGRENAKIILETIYSG